jgi:hypothetical protein
LAGATRDEEEEDAEISHERSWLDYESTALNGLLCEVSSFMLAGSFDLNMSRKPYKVKTTMIMTTSINVFKSKIYFKISASPVLQSSMGTMAIDDFMLGLQLPLLMVYTLEPFSCLMISLVPKD